MKLMVHIMGQAVAAVLLLLMAGGCTTDQAVNDMPVVDDDDAPVVIRASEEMLGATTRAEDKWMTGKEDFLFTYPLPPDGKQWKSLKCKFDGAGYGYVYTGTGKTLRWGDIYYSNKNEKYVATVYLDNLVDYPAQDTDENKKIDSMEFGDGEVGSSFNPYTMIARADNPIIQKYKGVGEPMNIDILWGKKEFVKGSKSIDFQLSHKMSKVTFKFSFSSNKVYNPLEGEGIKVQLENIKKTVYDNRASGTHVPGFVRRNSSNSSNDGAIVTIGDIDKKDNQFDVFGVDGGKLESVSGEEGYYATPAYIFPPYNYVNKGAKLTITLGNGDKYSGPFPNAMIYEIEKDGTTIKVTNDMAFLSGRHLTIKVELVDNYDGRKLLFYGVDVEDFTKDFDEPVSPRESGIYSWEDYERMVTLYNALKEDKEEDYRLYKYGTYNEATKTWTFYLWVSLTLEAGTKLPPFEDDKFDFKFTGHSIKIGEGDSCVEIKTKEELLEASTSKTNIQ